MRNNNNSSSRNNNSSNTSHGAINNQNTGHTQEKKKHHQNSQPNYHHNANQRERSGQRSQHPDSSMSRDSTMNQNLGAIRFTPGLQTRELPPIETKADPNKKFTGRCRLFVGNLPHNTSEDKMRSLFENYGEVGEIFLGPKSAFGFVKMDTRQNAEAARDALDCSNYEGRILRVRLAAHAAAIRIKHLSPQVTNELLAYAFRYFGEVERAVVVVDDKGKSTGEGIVEYSRKQSALYATKRCQQECFILTASPKPVLVELFDQHDEDEGLPEKSINKNSIEFKEQRDVGPRFAEQNSFEHTFAMRWKELYAIEKQKRERLEQEIEEARKNLQDQIEYSRVEHDAMQLRNRLQQLEGDRVRLQQLKEQTINDSQQRDEERRQQDLMIRQREEEILRRQQMGDLSGLNQQEAAMRMQANALQNLLGSQEHPFLNDVDKLKRPQSGNEGTSEANGPQMTLMGPAIAGQARSFAEVAMSGMTQPYLPVQQPIGMPVPPPNPQLNPPNMFTPFMPPQPQMQLQPEESNNFNEFNMNASQPVGQGGSNQRQTNSSRGGFHRQNKYSRQYNNSGNNTAPSNNGGRQRKRGRF